MSFTSDHSSENVGMPGSSKRNNKNTSKFHFLIKNIQREQVEIVT